MKEQLTAAWSSNDWPQNWADPSADPAAWQLRMAVVIPAFGRLEQLEVLLAALTLQTYPSELTEVIVVDDGSDPPLEPTLPDGLDVTVLRQERDGFGLARARNLGAFSSTGDVVVFLDADMLPETTWLEAHARPHHHHRTLAGVGPRTHVSRLQVGMDEVRSGTPIQDLLADADPQRPQWILDRWETTNDGRIGDDIWWGMSGGNFSVDRRLFADVGGYDDQGFKEWGGEDNDLGYRIYQSGAFIVPIHEAMAWHLGPATNDAPDIEERRRRIKIRLASRIASEALPRTPNINPRVPDIKVEILNPLDSFEQAVTQIGSVLSDALHISIRVSATMDNPAESVLIQDYLAFEPRAGIGRPDRSIDFAPITVRWDDRQWPSGLARWLVANVEEGTSSVVRIDGDDRARSAWSTRVLRQVESGLVEESEAYDRFGGRTVRWDELLDEIAAVSSTAAEEWQRRATAADAKLAEISNRRAVRLANSFGTLVRARSLGEVRNAFASLTPTSRFRARRTR
jgi:GT2 family glycosyltransferase